MRAYLQSLTLTNSATLRTRRSARLLCSELFILFSSLLATPVAMGQDLVSVNGDYEVRQTVERMEMIVKSSRILKLDAQVPRFQVHNEEVLGVTPVSENQLQIFGKNPGTTQVNIWDADDKLYTVDVTVVADAREVEGILASQLPLASLKVTPIKESAILSGYVTSVDDVDRAVAITEQFYTVVINNIEVVGVQQVLLHTKIMEVSRTKLRQLGIDFASYNSQFAALSGPSGLLDVSQGNVGGDGALAFAPFGGATNQRININNRFESFVQALHEQKLVKLLAEPTVVATHGRPSRFTVGGRVPNVIPGANGQVQVTYEEFGTSIDFLPFVVGPGRIRLEVRPEVSEPDPSRAVTVQNTNVQAFSERYVETAVEMQAGQTFALAGLLQTRTDSVVKRVPFLGHLPYIGTFFRNVEEKRNEIELLIMVTPELVDAMDPHEVPAGGPGLNSDSPDEVEFYFHGHIEVPNLKGDNCDQEGQSDCDFQGGMLEPQPTFYPQDGAVGSVHYPPQAANRANSGRKEGSDGVSQDFSSQRVATRWNNDASTAQGNASQSGTYGQPQYQQAGYQQQGFQQQGFQQQRSRPRIESGTLLPSGATQVSSGATQVSSGATQVSSGATQVPSGAIRPSETAVIVGDGVSVSQPSN